MRRHTVAGGVVGLLVSLSAVLALTGVAQGASAIPEGTSVVPTSDIVGAGLVSCALVQGEVGYSPASIAGGTAAETVSIWFKATKCVAASSTTKLVPTSVIGSMSFISTEGNACPLTNLFGKGILNLTYNFPPVPNPMIDPSVAPTVTVTEVGAFWDLAGPVTQGSYPNVPGGPSFSAVLKPVVIGAQTCGNGITSEYITRGTLTDV
jgi:hypothetical protein